MNIALVGAPGSGKSALASALSEKLPGQVKVVDDYVDYVERHHNRAGGTIADYITNLTIALERYARECQARDTADTVISCGSFIETALYISVQFESLMSIVPEEGKPDLGLRIDSILRTLAVLYADIFSYDVAFYLQAEKGDEETMHIDRMLQGALSNFKLIPVTAIASGPGRVEQVLEALGEVQAS